MPTLEPSISSEELEWVTGGLVGGQLELITLCLCTETRENLCGCICILTCITKP